MQTGIGAQTHSNITADETVEQAVAGSGKNFLAFNFTCFNPDAAAVAYVQFFDALAANVTLGTTVPKFVLPLPAGGGIDGANYVPKKFSYAITYAVTAGPGNNVAPASDCIVQFDYL